MTVNPKYLLFLTWLAVTVAGVAAVQPHIIFILTDDVDLEMGSLNYMPKLQRYLGAGGATFLNTYASVPVCCPSRSSILSSGYFQRTSVTGNTVPRGCYGSEWINTVENDTFVVPLQEAGYYTSYAGKYMNTYGTTVVPKGWDNWAGLYGNSVYYSYTLNVNGKAVTHGTNYTVDYLTDVVKNFTITAASTAVSQGAPLFAMAAVPAAHTPADAAPQNQQLFQDVNVSTLSPLYNISSPGSHWLEASQGYFGLHGDMVELTELLFRRRLQALQSVDDMIEAFINLINTTLSDRPTYILFGSDNGYHVGAYGMSFDKRQAFSSDVHLPMYFVGPDVPAGANVSAFVSMVDVGPTILDLAGLPIPPYFDGRSFLPFVIPNFTKRSVDTDLPVPSQLKVNDNGLLDDPRQMLLVQYAGESIPGSSYVGTACSPLSNDNTLNAYEYNDQYFSVPPLYTGSPVCSLQDSLNNTYTCLYVFVPERARFCLYNDTKGTIEYYNFETDPLQINNTAEYLDPSLRNAFLQRIELLNQCQGSTECEALLEEPIM